MFNFHTRLRLLKIFLINCEANKMCQSQVAIR